MGPASKPHHQQEQQDSQEAASKQCRLCLEEDAVSSLVSCCSCTGSVKWIHARCLRQWQHTLWMQGQFSRMQRCDLCCEPYQQPAFDPSASLSLWERVKQRWVQLQSSPEAVLRAWRCCILLGGLAAGTRHGVAGLGAGLKFGLRLSRPLAALTFRLMPQLSVAAAAVLPSCLPVLRNALRCSCSLMVLQVLVSSAAGLFGGGVVGFCLGTVGVLKLSANVGCQAAAVAAKVAAGVSRAALPRALALALLKGGRSLQAHK